MQAQVLQASSKEQKYKMLDEMEATAIVSWR